VARCILFRFFCQGLLFPPLHHPCPLTRTLHEPAAPTGQNHPAQGWSGATTLGMLFKKPIHPNGVASRRYAKDATLSGLSFFASDTQGSSCLATLG
jgi:hypothetical protein